MATLDFGRKPDYLRIRLTKGSPFVLAMTTEDGELFTAPPRLFFPTANVEWQSDLDDTNTEASWSINATEVDLIVASGDRRARLLYNGLVWAEGKFEVDRD